MSYDDFLKEMEIEHKVYKKMCLDCMYAKKCHEECETCEEFDEMVEMEKKHNVY